MKVSQAKRRKRYIFLSWFIVILLLAVVAYNEKILENKTIRIVIIVFAITGAILFTIFPNKFDEWEAKILGRGKQENESKERD